MKILHLEDDAADAEIFEGLLFAEWPDCKIRRMDTREDFEEALQTGDYDLILSDYTLPNFDGLSALAIARRQRPEIPFVFLSGTIGEQRAIEALRHGANDYVLKEAPNRLVAAIHSALEDAERDAARRLAEETLGKSRSQFRQIAESIGDFIVLLDLEERPQYANAAFHHIVDPYVDQITRSFLEWVHPEDRPGLAAQLQLARAGDERLNLEFRLLFPDGSIRFLEASAGMPPGFRDEALLLLTGRNISERKATEQALIEQASLLEKARDAIWLIDLNFTIAQWNASAERIYGIPRHEAIGRDARAVLFHTQEAHFDLAVALVLAQGEWHGEFRHTRSTGGDLVVDCSWSLVNDAQGRPQSILCIEADATTRRQLELDLQRSQRIEGLGMLAGGIAHDLNNILSPMLIGVRMLRPLAKTQDDMAVLDTLESCAAHGADLVQQIVLFARGSEGQRSEIRLGELLMELKSFLKTAYQRSLTFEVGWDAEISPVFADPTQIKQVVLNLCVNARDAMPEGGTVRITAENARVLPGGLRGFTGEIPAGAYVRLSVADTGTGMSPETLEKIFDPFFTTKGIGKGTGLGLSTIAGIVRSHGGTIRVESALGSGTTFQIYLPAALAPTPASRTPKIKLPPKGRGETVLVIDDDEATRNVCERTLVSQGYRVVTAENGELGLQAFEAHRAEIRAVVCDQMMPGISGFEILTEIHRRVPRIGLVIMSGLAENLAASLPPFLLLLSKPMTAEKLLRSVRQALDSASAKSSPS